MIGGLHLGVRLQHASLLVDQIRDPLGVSRLRIVTGAARHSERAVRVAKQREREAELFREGGVVLFGVEAGTENDDALLRVLLGSVPEPFSFEGSTRCVGLGIKPEEDLLTAVVLQ